MHNHNKISQRAPRAPFASGESELERKPADKALPLFEASHFDFCSDGVPEVGLTVPVVHRFE